MYTLVINDRYYCFFTAVINDANPVQLAQVTIYEMLRLLLKDLFPVISYDKTGNNQCKTYDMYPTDRFVQDEYRFKTAEYGYQITE